MTDLPSPGTGYIPMDNALVVPLDDVTEHWMVSRGELSGRHVMRAAIYQAADESETVFVLDFMRACSRKTWGTSKQFFAGVNETDVVATEHCGWIAEDARVAASQSLVRRQRATILSAVSDIAQLAADQRRPMIANMFH